MDIGKMDAVISNTLACYSRSARLPIKQMTLPDMYTLDPQLAASLQDKLTHMLSCAQNKVTFVKQVMAESPHAKLVGPLLAYIAKHGVAPQSKTVALPTANEMVTKYKTLAPFLLTNMAAEQYSLVGFSYKNKDTLWFSVVKEVSDSFICTDHVGGHVKVPFLALSNKGYQRLSGSKKALVGKCKKGLSTVSSEDVKKVGLYLGGNTLKRERGMMASGQLSQVLLSLSSRAPSRENARNDAVKI